MVREREKAFRPAYTRLNIAGTLLCLLSVLPVFATLTSTDLERVLAVCLLLAMAGFGAAAFTYGGTIHASMEKLLEEGDYTRVRKARSGLVHAVCVCYWLVVTAIYLLITFFARDCDRAGAELVRLAGGGCALRRGVRADAPLPTRK